MSSSRARGYGGYHGRTPFWKILLGTALAAVILASVGLLYIQRNMSFDSYGRLYFDSQENKNGETPEGVPELAFGEAEPDDESGGETGGTSDDAAAPQDGEAVPPEGPEVPWGSLWAYRINAAPMSNAIYWDANAILYEGGYNAVCVNIKDTDGVVRFPAVGAVEGAVRVNSDTGDALAALTASSRYSIARMCCFLDPLTANSNVNKFGLKNTGTYIFFDEYAQNWIDPGKVDARAYLYGLAQEAAAMGFDEILLTHVGYPTAGKLDKIAYGDTPIGENLSTFFRGMREALAAYNVKLSVEVPKALLWGETDASGLTLGILAPWVDRVYAEAEAWEADALTEALRSASNGGAAFVPELLFLPDPYPARFMKIAR